MLKLKDFQLEAIHKMHNGCILNGGVGSGKSLTSLGYYYLQNGGNEEFLLGGEYKTMDHPLDLYILTTAMKRDKLEWDKELSYFLLSKNPEVNFYKNKVTIDSWNNIGKYKDTKNAFFIFDEDHVTGYGAWAKAFLKIAKKNQWILVTATAGDKWEDYIPVFIANGFYRNKTEFVNEHIVYDYRVKFPKVRQYLRTGKLIKLRRQILVPMDFNRATTQHHEDIFVKYDIYEYKQLTKFRQNLETGVPFKSGNELCYAWRKLVNSDISRQIAALEIFETHPKLIIFYNFDYELEILREIFGCYENVKLAEWNGHKHDPIPETNSWVYLVQYNAGSEGWNCTKTDTILFYSQTYSYKSLKQAEGRIDRMNTKFSDLYYYHLKSHAPIDIGIARALKEKKNFNESAYLRKNSNSYYEGGE